jgi:YD repeat-containing protein
VTYDLNSNVTQRTSHEVDSLDLSAVDLVWEMQYDELNRRTLSTFKGSDGATGPNPVETVNTLDTRNLVIQRTDADGVPTAHEYDGLGRLTKTRLNAGGTDPAEIVIQAAFDKVGNVTSRTDAASHVTSYAFDDQNRLSTVTHADGDWQVFEYNDLSRPSKRR